MATYLLIIFENNRCIHQGFVQLGEVGETRRLLRIIQKKSELLENPRSQVSVDLLERLQRNGKATVAKKTYEYFLLDEKSYPKEFELQRRADYNALPTYVEVIQHFKELKCPNYEKLKNRLTKRILQSSDISEPISAMFDEVKLAEMTERIWKQLIGEEWSVVNGAIQHGQCHSDVVEAVAKFVRDVGKDIMNNAVYGPPTWNCPIKNLSIGYENGARAMWYREVGRRLLELEEGVNYRVA